MFKHKISGNDDLHNNGVNYVTFEIGKLGCVYCPITLNFLYK